MFTYKLIWFISQWCQKEGERGIIGELEETKNHILNPYRPQLLQVSNFCFMDDIKLGLIFHALNCMKCYFSSIVIIKLLLNVA